jgi:hypothetical protein
VNVYSPTNSSLTNIADDFVDETPSGWLGIAGLLILVSAILVISGFLQESRDPNTVLTFAGASIVLALGLLNVFPLMMSIIVFIEVVMYFFINRGGYI